MFYSNYGSISCPFWGIRCRIMSWPSNPCQSSLKVIESGTNRQIGYGFLLVSYSNFVPKMNRFWDSRLRKMLWPWNRGQMSPKVIGTDTDRSGTGSARATRRLVWKTRARCVIDGYRSQVCSLSLPVHGAYAGKLTCWKPSNFHGWSAQKRVPFRLSMVLRISSQKGILESACFT